MLKKISKLVLIQAGKRQIAKRNIILPNGKFGSSQEQNAAGTSARQRYKDPRHNALPRLDFS